MLSTSNPIKAGSSGEYYREMARGEYYTGNGQAPGQWFGPGAKALGLFGKVEEPALANLLEGRSADGARNLVQNAGSPKRQQGWDETFSAPKPVSVLWASAPALRNTIERAHTEAVQVALQYLNDRAGLSRRGKGGQTLAKASLVFATFLETVSRDLDAQIHTHALALNVGVRSDGTTGALWSHELFVEKMAAGAVYRAQLAADLRRDLALSIQARRVGFDIVGMPAPLCRDCSKRRQAIEAKLTEWDDHSAIAAKAATLATRPTKQRLPHEELEARWRSIEQKHAWTEEQAQALLGQAVVQPASAQDLAAAVAAEAQRLPVQQRNRKHLVRLAGRLAIELNADGTALRAFYEEMLPVMVRELLAQAPAKDQAVANRPRHKAPLSDAGEQHLPASLAEKPAQPLPSSSSRRRPDAEPRSQSPRNELSKAAVQKEQPVPVTTPQPHSPKEAAMLPATQQRAPAPDHENDVHSDRQQVPTERPGPARPVSELAPELGARRLPKPLEASKPSPSVDQREVTIPEHLRHQPPPQPIDSGKHRLPSESQATRPGPLRTDLPQDTTNQSAPAAGTHRAGHELGGSAKPARPEQSATPSGPPVTAPLPELAASERRRPVRSVINAPASPRSTLAEFVRKYGAAAPTQNPTASESTQAPRDPEANLRSPCQAWPGEVQRSPSGAPTVFRVRPPRPKEKPKAKSQPVPHDPTRERKRTERIAAARALTSGTSAIWSEQHGGVMVRSDEGLTLVRFTPAGARARKQPKASQQPLNRRRQDQLVEWVKSSGMFQQMEDAQWSDSLQAVMVTSGGISTAVRLKTPLQPKAAGQQFQEAFLSRLERMPPAKRTQVRVERLAFWMGRRAGVDPQTINQTIRSIVPAAKWSFFRVESRQIFANSWVPRLSRARIPRLVAGRPPRYWGKVRWRANLLIGELRVQDKFLAPHAPSWSPFRNWHAPVLRLAKEDANLAQQQPLKRPEAKRVAPARKAEVKTTQQSQARRPTMEYGY